MGQHRTDSITPSARRLDGFDVGHGLGRCYRRRQKTSELMPQRSMLLALHASPHEVPRGGCGMATGLGIREAA